MMTLTRELKDKLELACARGFAARLVASPVSVNLEGATYKVTCPKTNSTHFVYIAKVSGLATFHCDCMAHDKTLVCRCAATALAAYKSYLLEARSHLDSWLPQMETAPSTMPVAPSRVLQFARGKVEAAMFQRPIAQRG